MEEQGRVRAKPLEEHHQWPMAKPPMGKPRQRKGSKSKKYEEVDPNSHPKSIYDPPIPFPQTLKKTKIEN